MLKKVINCLTLLILFSGYAHSQSELDSTFKESVDPEARNYVEQLVAIAPEIGKIVTDVSGSWKKNCNSLLTATEIQTLISDNHEFVDILKNVVSQKNFSDSDQYWKKVNSISNKCTVL